MDDINPAPAAPETGLYNVPAARAWYVAILLTLLYCISYIDRNIMALLASDISASLSISDTQIGILYGLGFGVLYAILGMPLAQMIDHGRRVRLVVAGVLIWSACTIASAFAQNFTELLVYRAGVAFGEAVLTPAALSIISDMFAPKKRIAPTSIYNSVGIVMGLGAYFVGGAALDFATILAPDLSLDPWRITFILVGAPGLILGLVLLLTVREPRRVIESGGFDDYASPREGWNYIKQERRLYAPLFFAMATASLVFLGFTAWMPTLLIRGHNISMQHAGYFLGGIGASCGIIGAIVWPLLVRKLTGPNRRDAVMSLLLTGVAMMMFAIILAGTAKTQIIALAAFGLMAFSGSAMALLPPLIIQNAAPNRMRARLMALNLMSITLVGFAFGPPAVAAISENIFSGPFALGSAMVTMAAICAPLSLLSFALAKRGYTQAWKNLHGPGSPATPWAAQ